MRGPAALAASVAFGLSAAAYALAYLLGLPWFDSGRLADCLALCVAFEALWRAGRLEDAEDVKERE